MDYEELITQLNLDLDNKESQEEAKILKAKLERKSFILYTYWIILNHIYYFTYFRTQKL